MARGDGYSIYKPQGRKKYRIEFKEPVKGKLVHPGFRDKAATISEARRLWREHEREQAGLPVANQERLRAPLTEAVELYLADLERQRKAPATRRHRSYKLKRLIQCCGWTCLADIRPDAVTRHLAELSRQGRAASTANAYRDTLNAFLEWCVDQEWLRENPIRRVRRSEGGKDRPFMRRAYTVEELRSLLAVADRHRDLYLTAALSGLRSKELRLIERRDIDLTARVWRIRAEVDKGARSWVVPILPDLQPVLERLCGQIADPQGRLFPRKLGNGTLDRHLKRAGITKVTPDGRRVNFHSFRYFFCTLLARELPIQRVKQLMRHGDIRRTVNLYMDLGIDDLGEEVWKLPSVFSVADGPQVQNTKGGEGEGSLDAASGGKAAQGADVPKGSEQADNAA